MHLHDDDDDAIVARGVSTGKILLPFEDSIGQKLRTPE